MFVLILVIAFFATLLGSISGASASLISIPSWIALGFPLPTAVACDKVSGFFWTAIASRNYLSKGSIDWRLLTGLSTLGLAGAYLGTQVTSSLNTSQIKPLIGVVILVLVTFTWLKKDYGLVAEGPKVGRTVSSMFGLPLGFYEGFFGSGNSIFTTIILCRSRGLDFIGALGHYYFLAFIWCGFAAAIYAKQGLCDGSLVLPAVLGSILGGQIGSRVGKQQGASFIKPIFIAVGIIFGFKLLLGY